MHQVFPSIVDWYHAQGPFFKLLGYEMPKPMVDVSTIRVTTFLLGREGKFSYTSFVGFPTHSEAVHHCSSDTFWVRLFHCLFQPITNICVLKLYVHPHRIIIIWLYQKIEIFSLNNLSTVKETISTLNFIIFHNERMHKTSYMCKTKLKQ